MFFVVIFGQASVCSVVHLDAQDKSKEGDAVFLPWWWRWTCCLYDLSLLCIKILKLGNQSL